MQVINGLIEALVSVDRLQRYDFAPSASFTALPWKPAGKCSHQEDTALNLEVHICASFSKHNVACRFLSCNDDGSEWQPHPYVSDQAQRTSMDAPWKDSNAEHETEQKAKSWWRLGLGLARRGNSEEKASLLPKQAQPLSFEAVSFRRQHVTGAAALAQEECTKCMRASLICLNVRLSNAHLA